jgi:hypothetical protein
MGAGVSIPATLERKLSPLTGRQVAAYRRLMEAGALTARSGAAAALCGAAGLVCATSAAARHVSPECGGGHQSYARVEVDGATFARMAQDPGLADFFREAELVEGATIRIPDVHVPRLAAERRFLPRELARPFELNNPDPRVAQNALLAALPIARDTIEMSTGNGKQSPVRNGMSGKRPFEVPRDPLLVHVMDCVSPRCSAPAMRGEAKSCVASLEELADFAASAAVFGPELAPHVASAPPQDESGSLQTARLVRARLLARPDTPVLTCHDNMYPFQMYYCHALESTRLYALTFELPGRDEPLEKVASCHLDTSQWPPMHPAFAVLHGHPGDGSACHYVVRDDLVFYVPA